MKEARVFWNAVLMVGGYFWTPCNNPILFPHLILAGSSPPFSPTKKWGRGTLFETISRRGKLRSHCLTGCLPHNREQQDKRVK
jgi:hypothetical protein